MNVGKKSHLGSIVLKLRDQIWQICARICNLGELIALTRTCLVPAVPFCENHFPDELPAASLPVPGCLCVIYTPFPVCPESAPSSWTDGWIICSPHKVSPMVSAFSIHCHVRFWAWIIALLLSALGLLPPPRNPNLLNRWWLCGVFIFCVELFKVLFSFWEVNAPCLVFIPDNSNVLTQ